MRNLSRMWSVDSLGPEVDKLIDVIKSGADTTTVQPAIEKLNSFLQAMHAAVWENVRTRYKGAEFEHLVHRLFEQIYRDGTVQHWGGAGEKGADLIVFTRDALGLEYKIAVQVKLHEGTDDDLHSLEQLKQARLSHKVDAAVVVTTAVKTSRRFEECRAATEAELGIDIRVITRDEFTKLVMTHLGGWNTVQRHEET